MVNVCILQTDNRPSLDYLLKTQEVNKRFCDMLGYDYLFLEIDDNKYGNIHPATKKIHIVNTFLKDTKYDILVFLDSDAWIQNNFWLNTVINNLTKNEEKQGCFSRDPYLVKNTFINSGSFILKINDFTRQMYSDIINSLYSNSAYHTTWPFDQYYIAKYIFENKDKFIIFTPDVLNTPIGKVLRHNWWKNEKMYSDLSKLSYDIENELCFDKKPFIETEYYDKNDFPNTIVNGYEYSD